ncbi:MAG: hypothetical protein ABSB23_17750 [Bryobacteraceae bacterium]|jgi:hypothetical protein
MSRKEHLSALADSAAKLAGLHQALGKELRSHVQHLKALASTNEAGDKVDMVSEFFRVYQQPGAATKIAGAAELFR